MNRVARDRARQPAPEKPNATAAVAYDLLAKGCHLDEIRRFIDAGTPVDATADTIPAPAPERFDPDNVDTTPAPPPTGVDCRGYGPAEWNTIAELRVPRPPEEASAASGEEEP